MAYRFLSAEQVRVISCRARKWLVHLQERKDEKHDLTIEATFQILVGLWICERAFLDDRECSNTRSHVQKICQSIASCPEIVPTLLQSGPLLALVSTGILRFFEVHNSDLESFAKEMSQLLQGYTDQSEKEANELFLTRFLLYRLHLHPPLALYSLPEMADWDVLQANDSVLKAFATDIVAATQFGQIKSGLPRQFLQRISSLLPILVMDSFHTYNLETGILLLRCMRYLNIPKTRSLHTGLDFLVAQQQSCGKFGFLAHEIARLQHSTANLEHDLKIYLPHTVSCLWTIAEIINPCFTLVNSF